MAEAAAGESGDDPEAGEATPAHLQTQAEAWFDGPEDDPGVGADPFTVESPSIAPTDHDDDDAETDRAERDDAAAEQAVDDIETFMLAARHRYPDGGRLFPVGCAGAAVRQHAVADPCADPCLTPPSSSAGATIFVRLMPQT